MAYSSKIIYVIMLEHYRSIILVLYLLSIIVLPFIVP
jgi:hypothetical protein